MKKLWPILSSLMIFFVALASNASVVMYKETLLGNYKTKLEVDDTGKAIRRIFERKDSSDSWKEAVEREQSYPGVSADIVKFFSQIDWLSADHIAKLKELGGYQVEVQPDKPACDSTPTTIRLRKNNTDEFEEMVFSNSNCGRYKLIKTSLEESTLILDTFDLIENIQMYREAKGQ
jgi:hypothetical protein